MTIKVLELTPGCMPVTFKKGDWYDLIAAENVTIKGPVAHSLHHYKNSVGKERVRDVVFNFTYIPLGVAMQLPKGCEAMVLPRSSTFKDWGLLQTNSEGVIDNSYAGPNDEWKLPVIALGTITIPKGTRIAQFRIQLNQKATFWQKLRWFFSSGAKLKKVAVLNNPNRNGFGSTNHKQD